MFVAECTDPPEPGSHMVRTWDGSNKPKATATYR